jgi:hypothetical protein
MRILQKISKTPIDKNRGIEDPDHNTYV